MNEPNIVVTDDAKTITCGGVALRVHLGKHPFVLVPAEVAADLIPDLIQALHTAHDIATGS